MTVYLLVSYLEQTNHNYEFGELLLEILLLYLCFSLVMNFSCHVVSLVNYFFKSRLSDILMLFHSVANYPEANDQ